MICQLNGPIRFPDVLAEARVRIPDDAVSEAIIVVPGNVENLAVPAHSMVKSKDARKSSQFPSPPKRTSQSVNVTLCWLVEPNFHPRLIVPNSSAIKQIP